MELRHHISRCGATVMCCVNKNDVVGHASLTHFSTCLGVNRFSTCHSCHDKSPSIIAQRVQITLCFG